MSPNDFSPRFLKFLESQNLNFSDYFPTPEDDEKRQEVIDLMYKFHLWLKEKRIECLKSFGLHGDDLRHLYDYLYKHTGYPVRDPQKIFNIFLGIPQNN